MRATCSAHPIRIFIHSFADLILRKVKNIINILQKWTIEQLPTKSSPCHVNGIPLPEASSVRKTYLTQVSSPSNSILENNSHDPVSLSWRKPIVSIVLLVFPL
jgi:hypothetical protein